MDLGGVVVVGGLIVVVGLVLAAIHFLTGRGGGGN
jgi:hypothetical protein